MGRESCAWSFLPLGSWRFALACPSEEMVVLRLGLLGAAYGGEHVGVFQPETHVLRIGFDGGVENLKGIGLSPAGFERPAQGGERGWPEAAPLLEHAFVVVFHPLPVFR